MGLRRLQGKVALVTGASCGIGRAIALAMLLVVLKEPRCQETIP